MSVLNPETEARFAYAAELDAFKPITIWMMLREAVENPEEIPPGFEWRVNIIRAKLIMAEFADPSLQAEFEYDPACWGLTGAELRESFQTSARGWKYYEVGIEKAVEYFELLAEKLRIERELRKAQLSEGASNEDIVSALRGIQRQVERKFLQPMEDLKTWDLQDIQDRIDVVYGRNYGFFKK